MGVLYYKINQREDNLNAFLLSIRLNPYLPELWYNLGVLYESCCNQPMDAVMAYERYLELEEIPDPVTKTRVEYLCYIARAKHHFLRGTTTYERCRPAG
ncbi:hypothetical protein EG329_007351 [Mollisiaceae sp. DMI_Dod_QoI]|nr:hypothetical protein EG329_007351 [Helotiales sp. DMI_Dod_QoI]